MQIFVMVTETWSYLHSQLDRARKIKVHVLKPGSNGRSYCGLQNHDDEGEMSWRNFVALGEDACKKCRRLTPLALDSGYGSAHNELTPKEHAEIHGSYPPAASKA